MIKLKFKLILLLTLVCIAGYSIAWAQDGGSACSLDTPIYCSEDAYNALWQATYASAPVAEAPAPVVALPPNTIGTVSVVSAAYNGHEQMDEANSISTMLSSAGVLAGVGNCSSSYRNSACTISADPGVHFFADGQDLGSTITINHWQDGLSIASNACGVQQAGWLEGHQYDTSSCNTTFNTAPQTVHTLSAARVTCPTGTTGTPPNCGNCPQGQIGTYPNCAPPAGCTAWGQFIPDGGTVPYFDFATVNAPAVCTGGTYTCSNATLIGYVVGQGVQNCVVVNNNSCLAPRVILPDGTCIVPPLVDTPYCHVDGPLNWGAGCSNSGSFTFTTTQTIPSTSAITGTLTYSCNNGIPSQTGQSCGAAPVVTGTTATCRPR